MSVCVRCRKQNSRLHTARVVVALQHTCRLPNNNYYCSGIVIQYTFAFQHWVILCLALCVLTSMDGHTELKNKSLSSNGNLKSELGSPTFFEAHLHQSLQIFLCFVTVAADVGHHLQAHTSRHLYKYLSGDSRRLLAQINLWSLKCSVHETLRENPLHTISRRPNAIAKWVVRVWCVCDACVID